MTDEQLDAKAEALRKSRYAKLTPNIVPWAELDEWRRDAWRRRVQAGQS